MNDVAVVICNYNKKKFILDCIDSVFKSHFKGFDLIVVDNASTDGSVDSIKERFGDKLTLLINAENIGGSGGFGHGMQYALEKEYRYIHLLDNDVIVDKNAIESLYHFMETNPQVGACGSLILKMNMKSYIQEFGVNIDTDTFDVQLLYANQEKNLNLPESIECDYVAACSAIYRAEVLKKTGIIDKEFFIYWDDLALSWEIRLAGYKICAYSKSLVWHHGSFANRNTFSRYYSFRNKIYCFTKYLADKEYSAFCKFLIKRLFRMFSVNRDNPQYIATYLHALDDALNNCRGKAESYKTKESNAANPKFIKTFTNKEQILIICDGAFDIDWLVNKIASVGKSEITVFNMDNQMADIKGVQYTDKVDACQYDIAILFCQHILDVNSYDRSKVYIDKYMNQILDDNDFNFYENYNMYYSFFYSAFYEFVKEKLDALREKLHTPSH